MASGVSNRMAQARHCGAGNTFMSTSKARTTSHSFRHPVASSTSGDSMKLFIIDSELGSHTVLYDESDFDMINAHYWRILQLGKRRYAVTRDAFGDTLYMHRLIMDVHDEREIDHINSDTLDN